MRLRTIVLAAVLACPSQAFAQTQKPKTVEGTDPLSVSASSSDNGPYGALWMAYLAPDGDLTVNVSHANKLSGQTMSHYLASNERVSALRRAIGEARFFQLKNEIGPATQQFHRPHYRLTVTLGARQHSVSLSDPQAIGATDEVRRFFVVWNALFSDLPFRPEVER